MRTTLTIETDIAAAIERLRKERDMSLKEVINQALRAGLSVISQKDQKEQEEEPYVMQTFRCGKPAVQNIDKTWDIIEAYEDPYKP